MVKVRACAKPKAKPKQDQYVVSSKKGRASGIACSSKKIDANLVPSCSACGEIIDNDTKAVQCENASKMRHGCVPVAWILVMICMIS